jgi:amidase
MKQLLYLLVLLLPFMACDTPKASTNKAPIEPPPPFQLQEFNIDQIQNAYKKGTLTAVQVTQSFIDHIKVIDDNGPRLNSVIQVNPDALKIAAQLDEELKAGKSRGPMHGIPVLIKDNIDTHDKMATTAGSRALKGSKPLQDSWLVRQLRANGAIILGKTNLSEWANFRGEDSSSGWSGVGGQTHNPYILDRNPCGSSSGSGAAVSANLCMIAIGTETNGSIVCPSSANGVVGIKPTVGLISRSGIIPISFTQDTPGPMARSLKDAAIALGAMVGIDEKDSKTLASKGNTYTDYTQFLKEGNLEGKRIGIYKKPFGVLQEVDELSNAAIDFLRKKGAEMVEIEEIFSTETRRASFQVMLFEYKDGLNNYFASLGENAPIKNVKELIAFNENDPKELEHFGQEYLEMAEKKGDLNSPEYKKALEQLRIGSQQNGIDKVMTENQLDAIIAPTGSPAWKTDWENGDNFHIGSSSPAAMSGYPNITVPMGFIDDLPVGLSFFGKAWSEPTLLEIAYIFEQGTKHRKAPTFKVE